MNSPALSYLPITFSSSSRVCPRLQGDDSQGCFCHYRIGLNAAEMFPCDHKLTGHSHLQWPFFFSRSNNLQSRKKTRRSFKTSKSYPSETMNPILTTSVCPAPSSGDKSELKDTGKVISFGKDESYKYVEEKLRYT